jgi:hypothetical protein
MYDMKPQVKNLRNDTSTRFVRHERNNSIMSLGLLNLGFLVFSKIRICSYTASIPVTEFDIK